MVSNGAREFPMTEREDLLPAPAGILDNKPLVKRLEGLSGMAWAYTVLARLNLSRYKANVTFSTKEFANSKTPSKFNQYIQGMRAPRQLPPGADAFDLVREVERVMQNAEATDWLNHPFWRIFSRTIDDKELKTFFSSFEEFNNGEIGQRKQLFGAKGTMLFAQFPPDDIGSLKGTEDEPRIASFDDFVHLCAMFRMGVNAGYWLGLWQLIYLSEQAAEMNDVFRFIRAPFVKMLEDYYGKPEWFGRAESEQVSDT